MSNVRTQDILVGYGDLFVAEYGTERPEFGGESGALPVSRGSQADTPATLKEHLDADENWDYLGATQEGVELAYTPEYGEVEIDQLKDAARMFNQQVTATMNTNLVEATLQNLVIAWGVADYVLDADGHVETFSIGVPDEDPIERSAIVVGKGATYEADEGELSGDSAAGEYKRERVYHARRVLSIEGSTLAMRRTEATVYPVSFRLLPDPEFGRNHPTEPRSEYGIVIDRVPGAEA